MPYGLARISRRYIHQPNGKDFVVKAPGCSETNKYIQEAYLNGKPLKGPWFSHKDLTDGGELKLIMGPLQPIIYFIIIMMMGFNEFSLNKLNFML